jgi:hypothetical protein
MEAKAEGQAASYLEPLRKHEEGLEKTRILEKMATKAKMVISGKNGEDILGFFRKALA